MAPPDPRHPRNRRRHTTNEPALPAEHMVGGGGMMKGVPPRTGRDGQAWQTRLAELEGVVDNLFFFFFAF